MGAVNSCCIPRHRNSDMDISNNTSTPKKKGHHRNLSAAFNLSVIDDFNKTEKYLVNINTATEEEFMTLPGINRSVAKNIIDYRNHIGSFKCVEDLALASGVGAVKLAMILDDIYVVPPALSTTESRNGVLDNSTAPVNGAVDPKFVASVNSDNVFNLIKVKGIGMTLAKNIVAYREKHGRFKFLDDLLKVKGIGPNNLQTIKSSLTLENIPRPLTTTATNGVKQNNVSNGKATRGVNINDNTEADYILRSTASLENLLEILGPLAKVPVRPKVENVTLKHNNRKVFRLASWNLEKFSIDKASNPGVKDVICMTILENGLGILAVQEIADQKALNEICQELNFPTLPNVKKWPGRRGQWAVAVSDATGKMHQGLEYNGFLYDKSQGIELIKSCLLEKEPGKAKPFTRLPFFGIFKVNGQFDCVVVSVHLKATGLHNEDLDRTEKEVGSVNDVVDAVKKVLHGENDIIMVGDFNLKPNASAFEELQNRGYKNCIPVDTFTNISNNNPSGSKSYDNIWISKETLKVFTGTSDVIREGLTSTWIPNGWTWGGVVSDHCPVYAQFYSNVDLDDGDVNAEKVKFILSS
ncbi:Endonuclease/exonuclease/phosphatase domain-containing protein 1 [Bulinus truncatus]|nr:Endonuclease/exonuclease/phosphatase domain-containing protein 1 [Bulinus truncatus]